MKELRTLVHAAIKNSSDYLALVGGDISDPRIYWQFTPQKDLIESGKLGYCVYYRSGTVSPANPIDVGGRDDQVYVVEIWATTSGLCDDIADVLVTLFRYTQFATDSYSVLNSKAYVVGSPTRHDGRQLYTLSVNIRLSSIVLK